MYFSNNGSVSGKLCRVSKGKKLMAGTQRARTLCSINVPYLDGVSITIGNPHEHIWLFDKLFKLLQCIIK